MHQLGAIHLTYDCNVWRQETRDISVVGDETEFRYILNHLGVTDQCGI